MAFELLPDKSLVSGRAENRFRRTLAQAMPVRVAGATMTRLPGGTVIGFPASLRAGTGGGGGNGDLIAHGHTNDTDGGYSAAGLTDPI